MVLEIPAGTLDPGEAPVDCVARELEEETGYRPGSPGSVEALGWIWPTPGFSDERIWLFLVTGLVSGEQKLDDDEVLSVVRMPWFEALAAARDGSITDGKSVCALLRAGAKRSA